MTNPAIIGVSFFVHLHVLRFVFLVCNIYSAFVWYEDRHLSAVLSSSVLARGKWLVCDDLLYPCREFYHMFILHKIVNNAISNYAYAKQLCTYFWYILCIFRISMHLSLVAATLSMRIVSLMGMCRAAVQVKTSEHIRGESKVASVIFIETQTPGVPYGSSFRTRVQYVFHSKVQS